MADFVVCVASDANTYQSLLERLEGNACPQWIVPCDYLAERASYGDRIFFQDHSGVLGYVEVEDVSVRDHFGHPHSVISWGDKGEVFVDPEPCITPMCAGQFMRVDGPSKQWSGSMTSHRMNMNLGSPKQTYFFEVRDEDGTRRNDIEIIVKTSLETEMGQFFSLNKNYRIRIADINSRWMNGPFGFDGDDDA